uniref:Uncharacterized protein n=1 Tax=Pavo cristatus TaxID=9049 RepID=A0A8C9EQP8_PAVCR
MGDLLNRHSAFSKGIKLWRPGPSNGLLSASVISAIPDLLTLIRFALRSTAPTFATEPLITAVAVMPFRKEAIEMHKSPPLEKPSNPIPGPLTWRVKKQKS